jgi:hypothetical protein
MSEKRFGLGVVVAIVAVTAGVTTIIWNGHNIWAWLVPSNVDVVARRTTLARDPRSIELFQLISSLRRGAFESAVLPIIKQQKAIRSFAEFADNLTQYLATQLRLPLGQKKDSFTDSEIRGWLNQYFGGGGIALNEYTLATAIGDEFTRLVPEPPDNPLRQSDTVTEDLITNRSNRVFHNVRVRVARSSFFSYQINDEPLKRAESTTEISIRDLRPSDSCKVRVWQDYGLYGEPFLYVTSEEGSAPVKTTTKDPFEKSYPLLFSWLYEPLPIPLWLLVSLLWFVYCGYAIWRSHRKLNK